MNIACGNWRKSTYSRDGGSECVEVAELGRGLAVRDSTDPDGPRLAFGDIDWDRFLSRVRHQA
ncbi:MAG TPA: DUF397 domain-containing protein [Streptosporangiaceae bacterium]